LPSVDVSASGTMADTLTERSIMTNRWRKCDTLVVGVDDGGAERAIVVGAVVAIVAIVAVVTVAVAVVGVVIVAKGTVVARAVLAVRS
jgi:hypothetical protein